jgi:hypothetical protein
VVEQGRFAGPWNDEGAAGVGTWRWGWWGTKPVWILLCPCPEYEGKLIIAKHNIDDNPQTPAKYGVRGIPTLMIFKDGNIEATKVGALSKSQLAAFIDSTI